MDVELNYPESLDSLRWVGGGIHAPKELGRAIHFAEIVKHDKEEMYALPVDTRSKEAVPVTATKVAELSEDWLAARYSKP